MWKLVGSAPLLALFLVSACSDTSDGDGEPVTDAGFPAVDGSSATSDAGSYVPPVRDGSTPDAGSLGDAAPSDAAPPDAAQDAGGDAGGPDAGSALKPKCVKKDSQVLVIGDSFINWISHSFPTQLKTATKQDWRMLAVGGTAMGSGGIGLIPTQFDDSIRADPDGHTVLMDGGGNDILVADSSLDFWGECKEAGSSTKANCQKIVKTALDAADALLDRAHKAGIRDVVYFFYPHVPEGRLIGGPKPNEILDYALPMVKSFCDGVEGKTNGETRCHFIDMIPVFKNHTPDSDGVTAGSEADWFNEDIHPNSKGSQGMVNKVWEVMTAKCIGQKSMDCCED